MFKKVCVSLLLLTVFFVTNAQNSSYLLKGQLVGDAYNGAKVYLQKPSEGRNSLVTIDSTTIEDEKFTFRESIRNAFSS
ncbi:MAG: hypothetical protein RL662_320, partial [Bacteroidota bacterium]